MDNDVLLRTCAEITAVCACEGLRRTARAVTSVYQGALAGSGVRVAQLPILVAAQLVGPAPLTAVADALLMDRTTLTRNLAALTEGGLVTVEEDDDRRVRLVSITPAGRDALEAAAGEWRTAQDRMAATFGPARLQALVDELRAFAEVARS